MSNWFPLKNFDHFNILQSLSKPNQIASRIAECGYDGAATTNCGSISNAYQFKTAMSGKKCIFGCQFNLSANKNKDAKTESVYVIAKNIHGWKDLVRAVSFSNDHENFFKKPTLMFEELTYFYKQNWFVFSGTLGSEIGNCIFENPDILYSVSSYEDAKKLVIPDWSNKTKEKINKYRSAFGNDFFLEIQLNDQDSLPANLIIARILRKIGSDIGVPRLAVSESHYTTREDASDHRLLLACGLKTTLKELETKITMGEDPSMKRFLKCHSYYIPSLKEMNDLHTQDELDNTILVSSQCENYSIDGKPLLPEFPCPDGLTPKEYLKKICLDNWNSIYSKKIPVNKHNDYLKRFEDEYKILTEAGLASYFLMVNDYIKYARDVIKCRVGKGRGSAAGCMVSYLSKITDVDPIRFNLLFERFYNAGRNTKDRIAFPDIDSDFPVEQRDSVIEYIRNKYGESRVCHIATYGRMQGRGAMKDVLRAHASVDFSEMNRITENIPDESKIIDDLQEMFEEFGESSIIRWALENNPERLKEWCWIKENKDNDIVLDGPLSIQFAQAIRLEGTYRSQGKHASGIIVSSIPIADVVPMIYDTKSKQKIAGVDMRDAEKAGLIKVDILSLLALDRIQGAESIIRTGQL